MTDNNLSELVTQSHFTYMYYLEYPQGSTLEPLLFSLHINELPNCLSTTHMLADDSKRMHIIHNFNDTIYFQDDLNSVYHWLQT